MIKSADYLTFLLMVSGAIALFCLVPDSSSWLYDRDAILNGEIWRLVTGHFVHFTSSHLTKDIAGFVLASILLIRVSDISYLAGVIFIAVFISFGMLLMVPEMAFYGGLSGIIHGLVCIALLELVVASSTLRRPAIFIFAVMTGYLFYALISGMELLPGHSSVFVATEAHVLGTLAGIVHLMFGCLFQGISRLPRIKEV